MSKTSMWEITRPLPPIMWHPGLEVVRWVKRGADFLAVASYYANITGSGSLKSVRLYPTITESENDSTWSRYRAVFETDEGTERARLIGVINGTSGIFDQSSSSWGNVDMFQYGQRAIDVIHFQEEQGRGNY